MDLSLDYNNVDFIPEGAAYVERWQDDAGAWRALEADVGRARLNQSYGPGERHKFDLFYPAGRPEGLLIFVHGGYWLRFGREYWSHFASGATAAGWAVGMPSYTLAPEVRIRQITAEIATAIGTMADMVPGPVVLAGHSAGGHLVSRMAQSDGPLSEAVTERITHVMPISPVSDLRPLMHTAMNTDLRIDEEEAAAESPSLHQPQAGLPVTVWVGAEERPVFLDQARWLADAWSCDLHIAPGRHHFDVIDELRDPASPMMQRLLTA